jgi:hypothetical protein
MTSYTLGGSKTFFDLSELALNHRVQAVIPASILIGFGAKPRFMLTDSQTGFI